jgi:thiol-disulfide isomerase/thioredoxin
MEQVIELLK